ncbi:CHRD domain-containing protein [Saccharobesus litoralis]|uniref:CHRD domain-containing protein n=1 Tax=Saccharobesus litoralis TaxID=2172099 RepID=A0A2S0VXD6_9ALTE|nr:CHRD domain-containing protein [Saccharobesus litoralis]
MLVVALSACSSDSSDDDNSDPITFMPSLTLSVDLASSQQVPAVDSMSKASATIEYDENLMQFRAKLDVSEIDDFSAAHIHQGYVGENGAVAFMFEASDTAGIYQIEATNLEQTAISEMLDGGWYINVHTTEYPNGEVRGQVLTDDVKLMTFNLTGTQEVPAVDTDGMGYGYATYNMTSRELDLKVKAMGVDDASAAHIHAGRIGANGDVVIALVQGENVTEWMTPDNAVLDVSTATELMSGGHYVNLHSTSVPSGELRGQIITDNMALVTFKLDGEQEVPAVTTSAKGDGYALVNTDDYALELKVVTSGVADATAAHIHTGRVGNNGGVLAGLEQDTNDANVWMAPTGTMLTAEIFTELVSGGHYINVHTPANASGEIRGQILTSNFKLLTFPLEGSQQVPAVTTSAMGSGYGLINQNNNMLELKVVTSGLTDITAAHIHQGLLGVNGDVVIALEQDSGDMNNFMAPENTQLEQAILDTLLAEGHYVNVHTATHAGGEIRGQILP